MAYTQSAGSASGGAGQSDTSRGDRPGPQGGSTPSTPGGAAGGAGTPSTPGTMSTPGGGASGGAASTPGGSAVAEDQETIRQAQQQLKAAGFTPGPVDGVMDDQTRSALRDFQRSKGLRETGQLDQETRSALLSGSGSGTPPPSQKSQ
ncbi:MAG: peptidoglycan-binding protein [Candidatus Methylomirabilales bacterium]